MTNLPSSTPNVPVPLSMSVQGADAMHVVFILDRSGSMSGKEADVIGGFNSYVEELRANPAGPVGISYVRFDNYPELIWNDVPLADVPQMTSEHYQPRGSTALLDAVGSTVSAIHDMPEQRYIVIVHTDGMENASREWTKEKVKDLIEKYDAKDNWTFAFFGEGPDAWAQANDYGYARARTASYAPADMRDVYFAKARATNVMRDRGMRGSKNFGDAVARTMKTEASEDEIEELLKGGEAKSV